MNTETKIVLAEAESAQLEKFEAQIEIGLKKFIEVGEALSAIRDAKLYRASHGTFEDYCLQRWNMKRAHAYRLIEAADVVSPIGDKSQITTESQARELSRVEPAKRQEVVERASANTGGKLTAAAIKEAAQVIEMTPARPVKIGLASDAIFIADGAIEHLKKIRANDPARKAALNKVRVWCFEQVK